MRCIIATCFTLLACSDKTTPLPATDSGGDDTDVDTGPEPDPGTDDDGDGWTVEEGDCDDADIYVNPAWDEDTTDGKDNDCDTRIDERWSGVTVAYTNASGPTSFVNIDKLGTITDELDVDEACAPSGLDAGIDGGWVVNNGFLSVAYVDADGGCTDLAEYSEDELYVYGVATHPDGYYVATLLEKLVAVDSDGTSTDLATWNADYSDPDNFELAVYSISVDLRTGTVGLFDYFGGFATWNATDGLVIHRKADLNNYDGLATYAGAAADGGGWYVAAVFEGAYGIYEFDMDAGDWVLDATWTDTTWTPSTLAIDGDSGDWYVTANAGWYPTVWRVRVADGSVTNLYIPDSDDVEANRDFAGIIATYE